MYVPVPSLQVGDEIAIDGDNPDGSDTMRIAKILHEENIESDPDDIVIWFWFVGRHRCSRWDASKCGPKAWLVEEAS